MDGRVRLRGARRIRWDDPSVNVVVDGNSLSYGYGGTAWTALLPASAAAVTNVALGGDTWRMMDGLDGGVQNADAAWVAGKKNVLVAWEHTNSIVYAAGTAASSYADMLTYLDHRRAAHAWDAIVLIETLPIWRVDPTWSAAMNAVDELTRSTYRDIGISRFVELRKRIPEFNFDGFTLADFDAHASLWYETGASNRTHLTTPGYQLIADMMYEELQRVNI